jgi:hypothetical protein
MTAEELHKLSRKELLELLVMITEENERLNQHIEQLDKKLSERTIILQEAGSIAEAALKMSGFFEAAQAAADLYLENIRRLNNTAKDKAQRLQTKPAGEVTLSEIEPEADHDGCALDGLLVSAEAVKPEENSRFDSASTRDPVDEDNRD